MIHFHPLRWLGWGLVVVAAVHRFIGLDRLGVDTATPWIVEWALPNLDLVLVVGITLLAERFFRRYVTGW